jgi:hypothetical protein
MTPIPVDDDVDDDAAGAVDDDAGINDDGEETEDKSDAETAGNPAKDNAKDKLTWANCTINFVKTTKYQGIDPANSDRIWYECTHCLTRLQNCCCTRTTLTEPLALCEAHTYPITSSTHTHLLLRATSLILTDPAPKPPATCKYKAGDYVLVKGNNLVLTKSNRTSFESCSGLIMNATTSKPTEGDLTPQNLLEMEDEVFLMWWQCIKPPAPPKPSRATVPSKQAAAKKQKKKR